jgi:hypothetical protein
MLNKFKLVSLSWLSVVILPCTASAVCYSDNIVASVSIHAICSGLQALDCSNTKRTETGLWAKP